MDADIPYKFNIVNCEKINSQFNFGKLVFMSNRISVYSCRLFMTLVVLMFSSNFLREVGVR